MSNTRKSDRRIASTFRRPYSNEHLGQSTNLVLEIESKQHKQEKGLFPTLKSSWRCSRLLQKLAGCAQRRGASELDTRVFILGCCQVPLQACRTEGRLAAQGIWHRSHLVLALARCEAMCMWDADRLLRLPLYAWHTRWRMNCFPDWLSSRKHLQCCMRLFESTMHLKTRHAGRGSKTLKNFQDASNENGHL